MSNSPWAPEDQAARGIDMVNVTVADGKYTVRQDASGRVLALRYGHAWRDVCGDGLILALAQEVATLRQKVGAK